MNPDATFEVRDARSLPVYIPLHIVLNTELSDNAFRTYARLMAWQRKNKLEENFNLCYGKHNGFTNGVKELKRFKYIDFEIGGSNSGDSE